MNTNAKLIDVKNGGGKTEVFHVSCFLEWLLMLRKGRYNRCIMQVFFQGKMSACRTGSRRVSQRAAMRMSCLASS